MPAKRTRRQFIATGASAAVGFSVFPTLRIEAESSFDLVIRNGTILDGTGGPTWTADLGIVGDTIRAIDTISPEQSAATIDAAGKMVSPGFIDIHSHSDRSILRYPTAPSRVHDGITNEGTVNLPSTKRVQPVVAASGLSRHTSPRPKHGKRELVVSGGWVLALGVARLERDSG